ncbi:MAG: hypothetical protein RL885_16965 [Planctomycetota bacterium]
MALFLTLFVLMTLPTSYPMAASGRGDLCQAASMVSDASFRLIENRGQWREGIRYAVSSGSGMVGLEDDGLLILQTVRKERAPGAPKGHDSLESTPGVLVRLGFEGALAEVTMLAEARLAGAHHYFLGGDSKGWRTNVPAFGQVTYRGLYHGIDLRIRAGEGAAEYDVLLDKGADPDQFVVHCEGADRLELNESGTLVIHTAIGELRQAPPMTLRITADGAQEPVPCRYRLLGSDRYGFEIEGRDQALRYVIDPPLIWSTYLGGSSTDYLWDVDVDSVGRVLVGGSGSQGFPITPGAFSNAQIGAFVTQFDPTGSQLVFSCVIGGSRFEAVTGVAHDAHSDSVYITGDTESPDFPTTQGAFSTVLQARDAFVARLDSAGSVLGLSTFFGGADSEWVNDIAVSSSPGSPIAIVGRTTSNDLPVTSNAFDGSYNDVAGQAPRGDAFLTFLNPSGSSLRYSTYVGGVGIDVALAVTMDAQFRATFCGFTDSVFFPTTPSTYDRVHNGLSDAFVSQVDPLASGVNSLIFSTYLGGTGGDGANGLALGPGSDVTIVGETTSLDFPVSPTAFNVTHNGGHTDGFAARLSASGSSLEYATFLGSSGRDGARNVRIDAFGAAVVVGWTNAGDFPSVPGSYDSSHSGGYDVFLVRLAPFGNELFYGSYFGGSGDEHVQGMGLDPDGVATVAGFVGGLFDLPVTDGAYDTTPNGGFEGFVARLATGPVLGLVGTPSTGSPVNFELRVTSASQVGHTAQVALSCTGTSGILLPGGERLPLSPDACTLIGLHLGNLLRGQVTSAGRALTPQIVFPPAPLGLNLYAAAFTWEPASFQISSVTSPIQFQVQ